MSVAEPDPELHGLREENRKLRKINAALIDRVERSSDMAGNAFSMFETAITLEAMVRRLVDDRRMVLVAAVGNGGAQQPVAYPAAYEGVIGVTALDARGRVYRGAQRGAGVDLAAPGVGLLLATSIRGAREQTGTSFATPFVTAAAALALGQNPTLGPTEVAALLAGSARDTGDVGRDDVFGHGMLQAGWLCPGPPAATDGAAGAVPPPGE